MLRNLFDFQNIQLTFRICKKCFKISKNAPFSSVSKLAKMRLFPLKVPVFLKILLIFAKV